jgi:hypothetical protein
MTGVQGVQGNTGLQGAFAGQGVTGLTGVTGADGLSVGYTGTLNILMDGQGGVLSAGVKADITIPFNINIYKWRLMAGTTGTLLMGIWNDTYANYPPISADAMSAGATGPYLLGTDILKREATTSGWGSPTGAQDSVVRINIDQISNIKTASLTLFYNRI